VVAPTMQWIDSMRTKKKSEEENVLEPQRNAETQVLEAVRLKEGEGEAGGKL